MSHLRLDRWKKLHQRLRARSVTTSKRAERRPSFASPPSCKQSPPTWFTAILHRKALSLRKHLSAHCSFWFHVRMFGGAGPTDPMEVSDDEWDLVDAFVASEWIGVGKMGEFGGLTAEQQAQQYSSGYFHTFFKADDLDLPTLGLFPSNEEMREAAAFATKEVIELSIKTHLHARRYPDHLELLEAAALYQSVPTRSSRANRIVETAEVALTRRKPLRRFRDSTQESLDELRVELKAMQAAVPPVSSPYPADHALPFLLKNQLNRELIVLERTRHQMKFAGAAIRKQGRLSEMLKSGSAPVAKTKLVPEPSLRATSLSIGSRSTPHPMQQPVVLLIKSGTPAPTVAVAVVFALKTRPLYGLSHRANFVRLRGQAFASIPLLHENMHYANIVEFNPLKAGHFVLVFKPDGDLVLGEVLTIYSKGGTTGHEWIAQAVSVGDPSYVAVSVFGSVGPGCFSSFASGTGNTLILQIPRTHIVFSLASWAGTITRQVVQTLPYGHPMVLVMLCNESMAMHNDFVRHRVLLWVAAQKFFDMVKHGGGDDGSEIV
ncbi:ULP-PROTEASE domain-containing protein [Mycena chlorophos]|uniref:ULP-PROTEASE domain-containing protein n=1 Tax=Mycena chlorophos TaxID=658473 RepID=A0A8H6TKH8_MYCCL|nr:ULP-PROTEASE domain-containing protein [Mycena chlorophos]